MDKQNLTKLQFNKSTRIFSQIKEDVQLARIKDLVNTLT